MWSNLQVIGRPTVRRCGRTCVEFEELSRGSDEVHTLRLYHFGVGLANQVCFCLFLHCHFVVWPVFSKCLDFVQVATCPCSSKVDLVDFLNPFVNWNA